MTKQNWLMCSPVQSDPLQAHTCMSLVLTNHQGLYESALGPQQRDARGTQFLVYDLKP